MPQTVEAIYFSALEKGAGEERAAFLEEACGQDKTLRRKVDRMLSMQANVGEFLEKPAISHLSSAQMKAVKVEIATPDKVGKYEIIKEIGRGGMGVVYQAWDTSLKRHVAVKMVISGKYGSKQEQQRFRKESEVVAKLQHPNIVQIHEVGQHQDLPYLVLEWVDGGSLSQYCKKHKVQPREAAALIQQIARGLQFAHSLGVIHRDLKPGNILLSSKVSSSTSITNLGDEPTVVTTAAAESHKSLPILNYSAKITDFGLAKLIEEDDNLTQTGQVMGTPSYLSPEQAKGSKLVGPANDIYALGAILYELLSGTPPHVGGSPMETVLKVIQDEVKPLSQSATGVPLDLATICQKCLMRDPAKRYASAADLADDLQRYLIGEPIRARPVGKLERVWLWAQRKPALAATMGFAMTAVLVGTILSFIFGINATYHARQAEKSADEANVARKQANEERILAKAQSAALLFTQAQAMAEGGKIDQALFSMLRAWADVPEQDTNFQNAIRLNIDAWLQYHPRFLWQLDDPGHEFLCFANDGTEVITWKEGYLHRRDIFTGTVKAKVKEELLESPRNITIVHDSKRFALVDRKQEAVALRIGHVYDAKTLQRIGKPITMMKEGRSYEICRLQCIDDDELVVVRANIREPNSTIANPGLLQAFSLTTGEPAGPELVGEFGNLMEPIKTAEGTWVVLITDSKGNGVLKELLTGKEVPAETAINPRAYYSPARQLFHANARGYTGGLVYREGSQFQSWSPPRTSGVSMLKSSDGATGICNESSKSLRFYDIVERQSYLNAISSPEEGLVGQLNPSAPSLAVTTPTTTRFYQMSTMLRATDLTKSSKRELPSSFHHVTVSPDQKYAMLFQKYRSGARGWLMRTETRELFGTPVHNVDHLPTWSKDSRLLAVASNHSLNTATVKILDITSGKLLRTISMPQYVHGLAFSYNSRYLAVGLVAGVLLFDLQENQVLHQQERIPLSFMQRGPIVQIEFTPDDQFLIASSRLGWTGTQPGFQVWNVETGEPATELIPSDRAPIVVFDRKKDQLLKIDLKKGTRSNFALTDHAPLRSSTLDRYFLNDASLEDLPKNQVLNASMTKLAVGNSEGTLGLWNLETNQRIGDYQEHNDVIRNMSFSPDERWLAVGVGPHRIRIRDAHTGLAVGPLLSSTNRILTFFFSPDCRSVIAYDESGISQRWNLPDTTRKDRQSYQNRVETYTGMTIHDSEIRWLKPEELASRRTTVTDPPPQPFSQATWHREQALDCWRRRLDNAALFHLVHWAVLEPDNALPLLYQVEIHLAASDMHKADLIKEALIKRGLEKEVDLIYRAMQVTD